MPTSQPNSMTEHERIQRIGELICKAILCSPDLLAEIDPNAPTPVEPTAATRINPDQRIINYLRRATEASPGEMRTVLNLSRATTTRALQRLLSERRVIASGGRTSATSYRLADFDPSRN